MYCKSFVNHFWSVNGYFEEIIGNRYLTLVPTNEFKEKMKSMKNYRLKSDTSLGQQLKNQMTMMKNIWKSPNLIQMTKKMIGTHIVTIVVRAVFHENNNECLYKIQKWYITIELMFLKESILIKQVHQKSVIFVTISIFETIVLIFNQMSAIGGMIY